MKTAVFTQYPRPGVFPSKVPNSDKPHLSDIKIMGYSIRTSQYRYTNWVYFNNTNFRPTWNMTFGKELYDHFIDPYEDMNLINRPEMTYIINMLEKKLIAGWRYA